MRVVISGASGLIGRALTQALAGDGHQTARLVRRRPREASEISWQPQAADIDAERLVGVDAVVHLAGASVRPPWTPRRREEIRASRVEGTGLLARTLARLPRPPRVLLAASAVGIYGDTGGQAVDESAPSGAGFLADLVRAWEGATEPASRAGVRVVNLRSGIVLARHGGLLGPMLPLFRLGLGARIGSGRQYVSWISLHDEVAAIRYLLTAEEIFGPVNLTAPHPVTNAEYTAAIGRALGKPTPFVIPERLVRATLGDFAVEGPLASQRVLPRRLVDCGFAFRHPDIDAALAEIVGPASRGVRPAPHP